MQDSDMRITVTVDRALYQKLREFSKREGRTMVWSLNHVLRQFFEDEAKISDDQK